MDSQQPQSLAWLLPTVLRILPGPPCSIFEIGCGNGSTAKELIARGYSVQGIDLDRESIAIAKQFGDFQCRSIYDDFNPQLDGRFDVVLSLEVIEHLTQPREFAAKTKRLLRSDGIAIISTPYHGYIKNLALSLTNHWDRHHNPLWDGGHLKFWSRQTLRTLFAEIDFREIGFYRVGRLPILAKSMIGVYRPRLESVASSVEI